MGFINKITNFVKVWTNASDFPQYESSEAQVRADLQYHPDALKAAHDGLIDELEAETGASNIGSTNGTVQDDINDLQERTSDLEEDAHTHSNKATLDTYTQTEANLADAVNKKHSHTNSDSDISDAVSKKHSHGNKSILDLILCIVTSIGSTGSDDKIPTEKAVRSAINTSGVLPSGGTPGYYLRKKSSTDYDTEWSASALTNPVPVNLGGTNATTATEGLANLGGVPATRKINNKALNTDITLNAADVGAYSPGGTDIPITDGGTGASTAAGALYNLINALSVIIPVAADKFPFLDADGNTSGYVTLANLVTALKTAGVLQMASGSYVGTGTSGLANPVTLSFNFEPKLILVFTNTGYGSFGPVGWNSSIIFAKPATGYVVYGAGNTRSVSWGASSVAWCSDGDASGQLNYSGATYYYIAIG